MALTRLSGDSGLQGCPTVYHRDPRTLVVQGNEVRDAGIDFDRGETAVEISALLAVDAVCQLGGPLQQADLGRMLRVFSDSAFRLETLPVYREPSEVPEIEHFEATGQIRTDAGPVASWLEMVAEHTAAGRTMRRVHLVRRPLSEYLRWEFALQQHSSAAGEDVRVVDLNERGDLAALDTDFWLFDNRVPVRMVYDADGTLLGCERAANGELGRFREWRDLAWDAAVSLDAFLADVEAA